MMSEVADSKLWNSIASTSGPEGSGTDPSGSTTVTFPVIGSEVAGLNG